MVCKNESHAETLDFPVSVSSSCHSMENLSGIVVLLYLWLLNNTNNRWWLWWFSQLYQWFLHLKQMMILMIQSAQGEKKRTKPTIILRCTILTQIELENGLGKIVQLNWYFFFFIQTEMEQSGILQSAHMPWDLSIQGNGVEGVLAVKAL